MGAPASSAPSDQSADKPRAAFVFMEASRLQAESTLAVFPAESKRGGGNCLTPRVCVQDPKSAAIGARKLSQLKDNLASLDLSLSGEQLKTLDEASRIGLGSHRTCSPKISFAASCPEAWRIRSLPKVAPYRLSDRLFTFRQSRLWQLCQQRVLQLVRLQSYCSDSNAIRILISESAATRSRVVRSESTKNLEHFSSRKVLVNMDRKLIQ
jgi:hypothetical protein